MRIIFYFPILFWSSAPAGSICCLSLEIENVGYNRSRINNICLLTGPITNRSHAGAGKTYLGLIYYLLTYLLHSAHYLIVFVIGILCPIRYCTTTTYTVSPFVS